MTKEFDKYAKDLTLNKTQKGYLTNLLKLDWCYALSDTHMEYVKGRKTHDRLKAIADKMGGMYLTLYRKVSEDKQNYNTYLKNKNKTT